MLKGRTDAATQDNSTKLVPRNEELVPRKDGPFQGTSGRNHIVTVDVNAMHIFESTNHVTLVETADEAMQATEIEHYSYVPSKAGNTEEEYVLERIIRHKDDQEGARYLARRYGYKFTDNMWETPHHIPHHFIR